MEPLTANAKTRTSFSARPLTRLCRPPLRHADRLAPTPGGTAPFKVTPPDKPESLQLLDTAVQERSGSRFGAPPPALSEEKREQIMRVQGGRSRKKLSRLQKELPLEIIFKGRFEKSDPTIRNGEDLDVPTYIRRGVPLN
jgi:hypothetical protein